MTNYFHGTNVKVFIKWNDFKVRNAHVNTGDEFHLWECDSVFRGGLSRSPFTRLYMDSPRLGNDLCRTCVELRAGEPIHGAVPAQAQGGDSLGTAKAAENFHKNDFIN